ncbi:MAG: ATP-binding protein [Bacteroidota bacterium]
MIVARKIAERVKTVAKQMPVISITGPRQSGKTTLCRHLFTDYFYANLENPETRAFAQEDPKRFILQGESGMIVDEAQYAPSLFSYIQARVDETKKNGTYILSGSQNFLFMEKITQSLAGRVAVFHLLPFSLEEIESTVYFPEAASNFILKGAYPRIYDHNIDLEIFFPSYIQTYVERDIRQLINVKDLQQFQLFLRICAGRVGQLFNQSAIANEIGLTHTSVRKWLSLLQTSFITYTLPPYFRNFKKRLIKTPKLYFYDTGLACYLLGIRTLEELETHYAKGALFENFIITEVMKNFYNRGAQPPLYFWRDRTGNEIDLLIDVGGKMYPIEIKSSQTIHTKFFKNIKFFNKITANDPSLATIIYGGDLDQNRSAGNVKSWKNIPN